MNDALFSVSQHLVMIRVLCSVWSGQTAVKRETDLADVKGQLPSTDVMSDGVKKLVASDRLAKLKSLRSGISRKLLALGFDPLIALNDDGSHLSSGIVAVHVDKLGEAESILKEARQEFYAYLEDDLLTNLDLYYQEQEAKLPEDVLFLRRNRRTAEQIRAVCRFTWQTWRQMPAPGDTAEQAFSEFESNLVPALVSEIASDASKLYEKSFKGKSTVTQRAANAVRRLAEKVQTYSIMDGRLYCVGEYLANTMAAIPTEGSLDPIATLSVNMLLKSITNASEMLEVGERLRNAPPADDEPDDDDSAMPQAALFAEEPI